MTTILSNAFEGNRNIKTLSYQQNPKLQIIGEAAFKNAGVQKIIIANTVTSIGNEAFYGQVYSSDARLSFQENSTLRAIGDRAFYSNRRVIENTVLYNDEVYSTLPEGLEYIGNGAFFS